jgi:hypothetical protein
MRRAIIKMGTVFAEPIRKDGCGFHMKHRHGVILFEVMGSVNFDDADIEEAVDWVISQLRKAKEEQGE